MAIINKIDKFIDNKNKEIMKILNIKKKYNINLNENNLLDIFDNKKLILTGKYIFYGIYQPNSKLWIWSSSIPGINQNNIKYIDKLKNFSYLFENDTNCEKTKFYYQLLTQNTILITEKKYIKWINDLLLYLSNDIYIFTPSNKEENIQFIGLTNIKTKLF